MAKKSRDPRDLSHDDLVTWSKDEIDWLADHAGELDLTPRAGDFPPLAAAYEDAYNAEIAPQQYAPLLHDQLEDLEKPLLYVLRLLRVRIPLLPDVEEPSLAPFGLGDEVPTDWDKLIGVATVCRAHWLDISGGGVPPEFAAVSGNMAEMVVAADAFITKHAAYRAAIGDKQDAVAYKNQCREALLECEREIFHWYRAAHPKADDSWWSSTPWGTSSGSSGGGEPGGPAWPEWPGPVELAVAQVAHELVRITFSGVQGGVTVTIDRLKQGDTTWFVVIDGLPIDDPEYVVPFDDAHVPKGKWTYRVTPFNALGEAGIAALAEVTVK
jgi:hypothetical protein